MHEYIAHDSYKSRTAGLAERPMKSIQSWKKPKIDPGETQKEIVANLDKAAAKSFDEDVRTAALSYAPQQRDVVKSESSFSFGDVVDVVNPLHHLPIVGMVYRGLTNDEIHPMSQIVGGALYGGPIGAMTGTVNAVSKVQTGKDMADHALDFTGVKSFEKTERTISYQQPTRSNLSDTTLALADLSQPDTWAIQEEAPLMSSAKPKQREVQVPNMSVAKEPITQMTLSPMPKALEVNQSI